MKTKTRIYLDNAATSWPKPDSVYDAVDDYQRQWGAPAGRGAYTAATRVEAVIRKARQRLARLIGAAQADSIVFTQNGTDALNLALHGLLRRGDHVVTTTIEHNSVLRPLRWLEDHLDLQVTRVACDSQGRLAVSDIAAAITPTTRLVALNHASNVTGTIQPIVEIAKLTSQSETLLLVDAAQTLGHLPISVKKIHCDLLAAPGHKGLLGPLGTGMLYVGPRAVAQLEPTRQGGTGSQSERDQQPNVLPDRLESGNLNVPGIVGLEAGLAWLEDRTLKDVRRHELQLSTQLYEQLTQLDGVTLYGPPEAEARCGVLSFNVQGFDPREMAATLDAACGVEVRAGFHCAPLVHQAIGTYDTGGTVRLSPGAFSTSDEIQIAVDAIAKMAQASVAS